MNKIIAALAAIVLMTSAAHAFTTLQPSPQQKKQVKATLVKAAEKTAFYRGLAKDGGKPSVTVTWSNPATKVPGFIGTGYADATVTIRSIDLAHTRDYMVTVGTNGKFAPRAIGKWTTTAQPIGPIIK